MVKRINLRPSPERALADLRRKQLEQVRERDTVPHGVKDMGPTGDSTFIDEAGEKRSVRHFVVELDDTTERAEQLETDLASSVERIAAGETALEDLRDVRLPALEGDLADLDQALADGLGGVSGDLSGLVNDLAAARDQAVSAQQTADAAVLAASAASQAALQAAGIADSKGRVIYSETEPPAADRSSSNLWVKPSDASTRVWVPGQSEWVEVEDSDIKAAAQSAAAANTKAVEAASAAAQAKAAAATAQSTAEAAQRTADQGVLDARDAHNAALAAQTTADQMKSDLAKGPTVWDDPSFERGQGPIPRLAAGRIERVQEHATDGTWAIKYIAPGTAGNNFGAYGSTPVIAGHTYILSASIFSDTESAWTINVTTRKADGSYTSPGTQVAGASSGITVPNGKIVRPSWTFTVPAEGVEMYWWCGQPTAYNQPANTDQTVYLDELRLVDITDAYPALKAAQDAAAKAQTDATKAQQTADSKATPAQAQAMADAAKTAATTAASADATAKAAAAKTDALNGAAQDAQARADQAKADAIVASESDAAAKAETARQAAVDAARAAASAADALVEQRAAQNAADQANAAKQAAADALATARGQITSEITASANGKNATRWSTSAASASVPGVVAGDTWMQVDALATRNVKGQWTWDGSAWKPVLIRSEVIAALDVAKLTAGAAAIATAVIDKLFAEIFSAKKIAAGQIDAESIAAAVGSFVKINVSQLVATAADLNELVAQKIAAATASIQEAYIQNLRTNGAVIDTAVIADLAANLITSGMFRTAEDGQRLELTSDGLVLWGVDPDGAEYEMVRIGPSGTQLLTIGGATIDGDGNAVLQNVEARSLSVDGTSLEDRLAALPQGIIGRGYRSSPWTERRKSLTRVVELPVTLQPGRTYRVSSSPISIVTDTGAAWVLGFLQWAPMPVTSVAQFTTLHQTSAKDDATSLLAPMSRIVTTESLTAPKDYSFIIRTSCATTYHQIAPGSGAPVELVVEDLGPAISYTGANWQDEAEAGTSSGSTPPPATVQRYSLHRNHTAVGTYRRGQNGLKSSGDAVQGQYSSYGNREGLWLFADMTGSLSGSTVEKVILNFTISHTYASAGGIAEVRLHGNSSFPSGAAGLNTVVAGVKVKAGGAYSVTITDAAMCAGFRSGAYRGFGLSTDSTNLDHYVRGQNASIDITYRK